MTINQIDQLKNSYAQMIVDGMDMDSLITFAVEAIEQNLKDYSLITIAIEAIEQNIKDYDMEDLKEEIIDCYGEETWTDLNS